jgi:hypothetical protein
MAKVLGTVYRAISTDLIHKAGFSLKDGAAGAEVFAAHISEQQSVRFRLVAAHKKLSCILCGESNQR